LLLVIAVLVVVVVVVVAVINGKQLQKAKKRSELEKRNEASSGITE